MIATSHRRGARAGTITVTLDGIAYLYAFSKWREARIDRVHFHAHEDNLPCAHLGALSEIVSLTIDAHDAGPHEWTIDRDATGYTVRMGTDPGEATGAHGNAAAWRAA